MLYVRVRARARACACVGCRPRVAAMHSASDVMRRGGPLRAARLCFSLYCTCEYIILTAYYRSHDGRTSTSDRVMQDNIRCGYGTFMIRPLNPLRTQVSRNAMVRKRRAVDTYCWHRAEGVRSERVGEDCGVAARPVHKAPGPRRPYVSRCRRRTRSCRIALFSVVTEPTSGVETGGSGTTRSRRRRIARETSRRGADCGLAQ